MPSLVLALLQVLPPEQKLARVQMPSRVLAQAQKQLQARVSRIGIWERQWARALTQPP